MSTINSIRNTIDGLADLQEKAVQAVAGEIQRTDGDISVAAKALRTNAQATVIVDNAERYAVLTNAAKDAGTGNDFTALVARRTAEDAANRTERAQLENDWGTRKVVAEKTAVVKEELTVVKDALKDVSPEIEAFDTTTAAMAAHNERYPKAQITRENHDGYEVFSFMRLLKCIFTFNMGAHKAYKVVSAYNNKFGDYYEDAADIQTLRDNEERLKGSKAEKEASYNQLSGIGNRMDSLDGSYLGVDGIAREVGGIVSDLVLKNQRFGEALVAHVNTVEAKTAVVSAIKVRTLGIVKEFLNTEHQQVSATLQDLRSPLDELDNARGRVGGNNIWYDTDEVERAVERGVNVTRNAVQNAEKARTAINGYTLSPDADMGRVESRLLSHAQLSAKGNELNLDFTDLISKVSSEVREYEAEQARIREAQRRAREAQERADRAAREALESLNRRRNDSISGGFNSGSGSRSNDNISRGSAPRSNDNISRGPAGGAPRI